MVEYFHFNAVGHTVATSNVAGTVQSSNLYEAYGNIVLSTGSSQNNRLANTKERDFSIGLDNHGFRYFDPEVGRYVSPDPLGYMDGMNWWSYVHCNPINHIDPLGLGNGDEKESEKVDVPNPDPNKGDGTPVVQAWVSAKPIELEGGDQAVQVRLNIAWPVKAGVAQPADTDFPNIVGCLAGDPVHNSDEDYALAIVNQVDEKGETLNKPLTNALGAKGKNPHAQWISEDGQYEAMRKEVVEGRKKQQDLADLAVNKGIAEIRAPLSAGSTSGRMRVHFWYSDVTQGGVDVSGVMATFDVTWKRNKAGKISITAATVDPQGAKLPDKALVKKIDDNMQKLGNRNKEWEKEIKQMTGYNPFSKD